MKVLIADKISKASLVILEDNKIDFDYFPEITPQALLASINNFQALIVRSRTKVAGEIIEKGENLKIIGRVGSGVDNIDIKTAREKKIFVVNTPDANSQAVAEHTVGLMLSLLRKYYLAFSSMQNGLWLKRELTGSELSAKTVGIIGYGHVGIRVHKLVEAFGAKVIIYSRSYQTCTFEDIFRKSDIITLHLTLTSESKGCVDRTVLNLMKSNAYLINTSRGETLDEEALYELVSKKKIAGCALDVFWKEPLPADSRWRKLDNCLLTPHVGAASKEALERASEVVIHDVIRVLKGEKPKNPVSF